MLKNKNFVFKKLRRGSSSKGKKCIKYFSQNLKINTILHYGFGQPIHVMQDYKSCKRKQKRSSKERQKAMIVVWSHNGFS